MKKLALVVLASLALSGCTLGALGSLVTHKNVDKVCLEALKGAHTAQDVAVILERHGLRPDDARKLGEKAVKGEIVITQICVIADALTLGR